MASYKSRYSNDKSLDFIIPLMVLLFLGVVYMLSLRSSQGYVSFILIGVAAAIMIYWVRVLKKMTIENSVPQYTPKEVDTKNWVYDLIKGEREIIFVAEVPGPEDQVTVRLIEGILYVRGSGHFSKEVPIESTPDMGIYDFKYRNGVLTLKIRKLETL
ncbi:MAG: Hsp20/alpha crystallin family protein [Thaumarchaeota archaeon]|nr:Hsp20/alpha crystallin family protein [Nitrososphaerota archaeon]